jgi:hypothetical protein
MPFSQINIAIYVFLLIARSIFFLYSVNVLLSPSGYFYVKKPGDLKNRRMEQILCKGESKQAIIGNTIN